MKHQVHVGARCIWLGVPGKCLFAGPQTASYGPKSMQADRGSAVSAQSVGKKCGPTRFTLSLVYREEAGVASGNEKCAFRSTQTHKEELKRLNLVLDSVNHGAFAKGQQSICPVGCHSEALCKTGAERSHINDGQIVLLLVDVRIFCM